MAVNVWLGTGSTDWNVASNWLLNVVPTATDGHVTCLSGSSLTCSLGSSNKVCNNFLVSGFTNTLSFGVRTLTVSGPIYLETGMTITGTGQLAINSSASITTNGKRIPLVFGFQGVSQTYTLVDDLYCDGNCSLNASSGSLAINDNIIYVATQVSSAAAGCSGTTKFILNGTGTTLLSTTGAIQNDIDIDSTGTIQLGAAFRFARGQFRWLNGTLDPTTFNNTFTIGLTSVITTRVESSAVTWNNVATVTSNNTVTFLSDINVNGNYTNSAAVTLSGSNMNLRGTFIPGGSQILAGTTNLNFDGNNCWWVGGSGTNRLNTYIKPIGTFSLSGTAPYNTGTLTYISGNTNTENGILNITAASTLQTSGMSWTNVNVTTGVINLDSELYVSSALTVSSSSSASFAGNSGFTVGKLVMTTINRSLILKSGNTYTVNDELLLDGNGPFTVSTNRVNIFSNTTSVDAYLNLNPTGSCQVQFCAATDIDSSGGRQITNVKGSINRTTNWYVTNPDFYRFF